MITFTLTAKQVFLLAGALSVITVTTLALAITVIRYALRDMLK